MQNVTSSNWKVSKSFLSLVNGVKHNDTQYKAIPMGVLIEKSNHIGFDVIPLWNHKE